MDISIIEREALNLPASDRARLVQELLDSLVSLSLPEIENLWINEASRRLVEFDRGAVAATPADIVMQKARNLLK